MSATPYYTPTSSNRKTGNIPHQFIGQTRQESKGTCQGCALLETICYAHKGTDAMAHASIIRAAQKGKDYSLARALAKRDAQARFVRFGTIGDPSGIDPEAYQTAEQACRDEGLGVLSYTHFWGSRGAHLKGHAMASCDSWDQAEQATSQGWRAAVHVPTLAQPQGQTASGTRYTLCPAQRTENRVQCNDCGLCDATRKAADIIVFLEH